MSDPSGIQGIPYHILLSLLGESKQKSEQQEPDVYGSAMTAELSPEFRDVIRRAQPAPATPDATTTSPWPPSTQSQQNQVSPPTPPQQGEAVPSVGAAERFPAGQRPVTNRMVTEQEKQTVRRWAAQQAKDPKAIAEMVEQGIVAASMSPTPIGDVASVADAVIQMFRGDWKQAGLAAAGALPAIPSLRGVLPRSPLFTKLRELKPTSAPDNVISALRAVDESDYTQAIDDFMEELNLNTLHRAGIDNFVKRLRAESEIAAHRLPESIIVYRGGSHSASNGAFTRVTTNKALARDYAKKRGFDAPRSWTIRRGDVVVDMEGVFAGRGYGGLAEGELIVKKSSLRHAP